MYDKETFASSNPRDSVITASDICITKVLMPVNVPMKSVGVILKTPRGALMPTIPRPMEKSAAN